MLTLPDPTLLIQNDRNALTRSRPHIFPLALSKRPWNPPIATEIAND